MQKELGRLHTFFGRHPEFALPAIREYEEKNPEWLAEVTAFTKRLPFYGLKSRTFQLKIEAKMHWLLFRAKNLAEFARMLRGLLGGNGWGSAYPLADAGWLNWGGMLFCLVLVFAARNTWEIRWQPSRRLAVGLALLFLVCVATFLVNTSSPFLYFQF